MPNFNFSRNSLKDIEIKRWCKKSIQSECKDHEILAIYTKLPVLHEIEGIEDIKVLFLGKHLLKNIQVIKGNNEKKTSKMFSRLITRASPMRSTHGVAVDTL